MRLLKREQSNAVSNSSKFSLINFPPSNIPSIYAILSHRWGEDEVTLRDLESGAAQAKPGGYRKLEFCAEQAARDGILYFWIDTCCIDKANNTELSEAINSMFKWYQNATKCYVYLPDVSLTVTNHTWVSAFQASSWFTRGWTLQELIAPRTVDFFSVEGTRLGDKTSLEQQIHHVTKIPIEALRGSPLSRFTTEERFVWAAERHTTVEEDAAYCLLGLFDIHMPLIYGEGRQKALTRLRRKVDKSSHPTPSKHTIPLRTVPFERNPRFIGRETELAKLEARLFALDYTSIWAITGLGGIGKTQLVLELLYRTQAKNPDCTIMWIPAASRESLHQGYSAVARQLNIAGSGNEDADAATLVQNHLSQVDVGRWLLVFDNADDIDLWTTPSYLYDQKSPSQPTGTSHRLIDRLPRNRRGCIIFTTRDAKLAIDLAGPNILAVSELGEDAAKGLLGKYLSDPSFIIDHQQDVVRLLERLTCLPLAITQAATYIVKNGITVAEYVQLLEEKEEEVIDLLSADFEDYGRYREVKNPIATTWLISFEQIQKHDQLAAEYLSFMSCIHPKDIPLSLLPQGPSRQRELEAIGTLTAYSFVSRSPTGKVLNLHRLVHLATRNWLRREKGLNSWLERTMIHLEEVFPDSDDRNRIVWRMYLPHVLQILESQGPHRDAKHRMALMFRCGKCLYTDGRFNEAEILLAQVWKEKKSSRTETDSFHMREINLLAATYLRQGRLAEAEQLVVQTLETLKIKLGADHLYTLDLMDTLGSIYTELGRWIEAEKLMLETVENRKTQMGSDNLETLGSMGRLALIFWRQGRWVEAQELQEEVLAKRKALLGINHPDILSSMNNLATTFSDQGRFTEAEELHAQVLEITKKTLGVDHPSTLISMNNLAMTFSDQGRFTEAEELQAQVLETRKRVLGVNHPETLKNMHNLACSWKDLGRDEGAIQLMQDTAQRRARAIGTQHPSYLGSVEFLRRWEAERLEKESKQQSTQVSDETTPMPVALTSTDHPVAGSTNSLSGDRPRKIRLSHRVKNFWRSSSKAGSSARG